MGFLKSALHHASTQTDLLEPIESDVDESIQPIFNRNEEALDKLAANVMICDRDLKLVYMNQATRKTFRKFENHLPVKVDEMIGQSIHIFHKHPEQVERVLGTGHHAGAPKLPHATLIQFGPEYLELRVEAIHDEKGTMQGAVVVWDHSTARVAEERRRAEAAELQKEIDHQLQIVCSATLEMESSVAEIAKSAHQVKDATEGTRIASEEGLAAIENLKVSSNGVASVADLISAIATQTSVLALNATIEAARAGVHGKGFSVVAGEVKKLAEQTAKATADIQSKVKAIRENLNLATSSIHLMQKQAEASTGISHMLASTSEEQRAAVAEVARGIQEVSNTSNKVVHL